MYVSALKRHSNKSLATVCKHYVSIEERVNMPDGEGGFEESWVTVPDYDAVPAGVWPIHAKQMLEFKSVNVNATHYIIFRGEISLQEENYRIKFNDRYFEILTAENVQEINKKIICTVKERRE